MLKVWYLLHLYPCLKWNFKRVQAVACVLFIYISLSALNLLFLDIYNILTESCTAWGNKGHMPLIMSKKGQIIMHLFKFWIVCFCSWGKSSYREGPMLKGTPALDIKRFSAPPPLSRLFWVQWISYMAMFKYTDYPKK